MVAWNTSDGEVAIVAGRRTPFARMGTSFAKVHVSGLAKRAMQETLYHADWPAEQVDEVVLGNVVMPADAANVARVSALLSGIPARVPGVTVQRNCASGMEAISEAAMRIRTGQAKAVLAGGAESMSTIPLLFPSETMEPMTRLAKAKSSWKKTTAVASFRPRHFKPVVGLELGLTDPVCGMIMGKTAEVLAHEFGITRQEQDEFALRSHRRAIDATEAGRFAEEIVPVFTGGKFEAVTADNGPRANQTMEALAKLRPLFDKRDGTVTAGNSCQVTDGAVSLLATRGDIARAEKRDVLGYVRGYAYAGLDPARMGLGPVYAIDALLRQTGLELYNVGLIEINEAFAAQVLACQKAMASERFCREKLGREKAIGEIDPDALNVNGGAIALGHPVGATGTRLVLTLLHEMRRRDVQFGIAALCVGGGQGAAILLEQG